MILNISRRHTTGIYRDNFVVEAAESSLVLGKNLWIERSGMVMGDLDMNLTEIALI